MEFSVKKVSTLEREMNFTVSKDRVSKKLDELYKEVGKKAKIKGFRPGKAPRHVLEQHHGQTVKDEAVQKIIPEVYHEAIMQEKLIPIDYPEITDVKFDNGTITFKAAVELRPEVKIKDYKKIPIKRKSAEVTDEEMNKTMEHFKESQAKAQKKESGKDIKVDDEFAKGLGFPSLEEFKTFLKKQLEVEKERQNRIDIENQIADHLLKKTSFKLPEKVFKKQVAHRLKETQERLKQQGMPEDDINKREEEMHKEITKAMEREFKVFLIFEEIAQAEKITVAEGEHLTHKVIEFLLKEAEWK